MKANGTAVKNAENPTLAGDGYLLMRDMDILFNGINIFSQKLAYVAIDIFNNSESSASYINGEESSIFSILIQLEFLLLLMPIELALFK